MIADPVILEDIRKQWVVARKFASMRSRGYQIPGGPFVNETSLPSEFYNLPLVLAYGVLQQALKALANQRTFQADPNALLGTLMGKSRPALTWQNYDKVDQGRKDRNAVSHDGELHPKDHCLGLVDAVEVELRAWGVVA